MTAHATRTVPGHLPTMGRFVGFTVHPWEPRSLLSKAVSGWKES
jgi:hypothetical protein